MIMDRLYGGVCYAGIDTDPELKYPKGAGRVAFSNQQSYIAAISARFVQLQHGEIDKRVGFEKRNLLFFLSNIFFRLKLNHMYLMINYAMNALVHDVVENLLHFFVQMLHVYNIIVKHVGHQFIPVQVENIINHW
jgi:hypothetical protein